MPQDPGNPGPQNFDSRKTLETQDLRIWICGETLETQEPEPQNLDVSRLKRPWSLHHSIQNFMLSQGAFIHAFVFMPFIHLIHAREFNR